LCADNSKGLGLTRALQNLSVEAGVGEETYEHLWVPSNSVKLDNDTMRLAQQTTLCRAKDVELSTLAVNLQEVAWASERLFDRYGDDVDVARKLLPAADLATE
jgi:hypothetical protein